jgi:DNA-binding transcriptional LysR family regulator
VLATAACAEHVAGTVIAAFTRRVPRAAVDLTVGSTDCAAVALAEDDADIVLGVRPAPAPGQPVESVPFLRYSRVVVAAPGHPSIADLSECRWLAGPAGLEPGSEEERWADGTGTVEVERRDSEAEALEEVRAGAGVMLALEHSVRVDLARGSLVRVPVDGTPVAGLWWASVPGHGRSTATARALQRFLTTPDATSALLSRPERPARNRPTVRVELWS